MVGKSKLRKSFNVIYKIGKVILCLIGNPCNSMRRGVMWQNLGEQLMRRAYALWIRCSLKKVLPGSGTYKRLLQ